MCRNVIQKVRKDARKGCQKRVQKVDKKHHPSGGVMRTFRTATFRAKCNTIYEYSQHTFEKVSKRVSERDPKVDRKVDVKGT